MSARTIERLAMARTGQHTHRQAIDDRRHLGGASVVRTLKAGQWTIEPKAQASWIDGLAKPKTTKAKTK